MSGPHDRRAARRASALRALRIQLEAAVERAIAALDAFDGDADLEPSMGFSDSSWLYDQRRWIAERDASDREWECEDEGAQCEDEGTYRDGDDELSLCGITFSANGTDGELTGPEWAETPRPALTAG